MWGSDGRSPCRASALDAAASGSGSFGAVVGSVIADDRMEDGCDEETAIANAENASESASCKVDCRDSCCCYCIFDLEKPSRRLDSVSSLQRPTPAPARASQYAT